MALHYAGWLPQLAALRSTPRPAPLRGVPVTTGDLFALGDDEDPNAICVTVVWERYRQRTKLYVGQTYVGDVDTGGFAAAASKIHAIRERCRATGKPEPGFGFDAWPNTPSPLMLDVMARLQAASPSQARIMWTEDLATGDDPARSEHEDGSLPFVPAAPPLSGGETPTWSLLWDGRACLWRARVGRQVRAFHTAEAAADWFQLVSVRLRPPAPVSLYLPQAAEWRHALLAVQALAGAGIERVTFITASGPPAIPPNGS